MDIVPLLFYPLWINAVREEASALATDRARNQDRPLGEIPAGPNWRVALAPMALLALSVLVGASFPGVF